MRGRAVKKVEVPFVGFRSPLPALSRAFKLQARAAKVGFDWNDPLAVLAKNPGGSRRD